MSSFKTDQKTDINSDDLPDRGYLLTEKPNPKSTDLDLLSTKELVSLFNEEDIQPQLAVKSAIPQISRAVDSITERVKEGGRIIYLGAGTSGRLGVLDAAECPPTFCTPPELVLGVIAGGFDCLTNSSEGLEDDFFQAKKDLGNLNFTSQDCLIGITAGGTTPYVLGALNHGRTIESLTISISSVAENDAPIESDIDIRLLTGPEVLTGSTRLKAGTATKMALNIISTSVMIKLGKVYGNRMIDVSATNNKLFDRSLRILQDVLGVEREEASSILLSCNGSVKLSLLVLASGMKINDAKSFLHKYNNNLRLALDSLKINHTFV